MLLNPNNLKSEGAMPPLIGITFAPQCGKNITEAKKIRKDEIIICPRTNIIRS